MPRLLIAASGTGGHLFPALAVAEALPDDWTVRWLGVPDRLEKELVPARYGLFVIRVGGVQAHGLKRIWQLFKLLLSTWRVCRLLRQQKIDIIFTTGGYIAAPAILAATLCGLPVVIHESNAIPGRVTRLMGRLCNCVAIGLPQASHYLPNCKLLLSGMPVRSSFLSPQPLPDWVPPGSGPLLVVMGGSQGAKGLNQMVSEALPLWLDWGCRVVHLTGEQDSFCEVLDHPNLVVQTFSDEIPALLQNADLAISRAGASALSELAVCGTPAILVPYPYSKDKHQDANALAAGELGAAVIIHEHGSRENTLVNEVSRLLTNRLYSSYGSFDPLIPMKTAMKKLAIRHADEKIVTLLKSFI